MTGGAARDRGFGPERRVRHRRTFEAVYATRCTKRVGPFLVHGRPNEVGHARLGLAVPRRVGNAPRRNLVKRRLREAFRALHADLPAFDFVVHVRPHDPPCTVEEARAVLERAAGSFVKRGPGR